MINFKKHLNTCYVFLYITMDDQHKKFVEKMLESAEDKKETKPQQRFGSVNTDDVEKAVDNIKKGKKADEE